MPNVLVTPSFLVDRSLLAWTGLIEALPEAQRLFFVQELASLNKSLADVLVDYGMIHPDTPESRQLLDTSTGTMDTRSIP